MRFRSTKCESGTWRLLENHLLKVVANFTPDWGIVKKFCYAFPNWENPQPERPELLRLCVACARFMTTLYLNGSQLKCSNRAVLT